MRRLFIEVLYDQELVEVSGIHCSGSEWCESNPLERFLFSWAHPPDIFLLDAFPQAIPINYFSFLWLTGISFSRKLVLEP